MVVHAAVAQRQPKSPAATKLKVWLLPSMPACGLVQLQTWRSDPPPVFLMMFIMWSCSQCVLPQTRSPVCAEG